MDNSTLLPAFLDSLGNLLSELTHYLLAASGISTLDDFAVNQLAFSVKLVFERHRYHSFLINRE